MTANQDLVQSAEIHEVLEFIGDSQLLRALPEALRKQLGRQARIRYLPAGSDAVELCHNLVLVRTGSWRRNQGQTLVDLAEEHHCFVVNDAHEARQWRASDDSLVYLWSRTQLASLGIDHLMNLAGAPIPQMESRETVQSDMGDHYLMQPIHQLALHPPVVAAPAETVQAAAQRMDEARVSCLPVVEGDQLVGILTDRDLRSRVLAQRLDADIPIASVMTPAPVTIQDSSMLFESLLMMSQHRIHHLPVVTVDNRLVGILTSSDLLHQQQSSPIYLVGQISRQTSVEGLAAITAGFPRLLVQLLDAGTDPDQCSRVLTVLSDAITRRLLELGQRELGPAPCRWAWLAFGSQGRMEQGIGSDQDNGLLLEESATAQDFAWFEQLAQFVCDGLDRCGYVHCPGQVMAMNPRWRLRQGQWLKQFRQWIEEPTPEALMLASIFFDWRVVGGDASLGRPLQAFIRSAVPGNRIFLRCLTDNALQHRPPLGILGRLILERDGQQQKVLDLKHRGLVPLVDLARLYALAEGVLQPSTRERLEQVAGDLLSDKDAGQLLQAWTLIARIRLRLHADLVEQGAPVSNLLPPRQLNPLQRQLLKDAFALVMQAQEAVRLKMGG